MERREEGARPRRVYFDHNATTPLHPEVAEAMAPLLGASFGNPSSIHGYGREARRAVERAREEVAALLGARDPQEVVFTSGGTEGDNTALRGVFAHFGFRGHLVTSRVEHPAVLDTARVLERLGVEVTYLPVDGSGRADPEAVAGALREDTRLISLMWANNEVGTLQPVREVGALARERGVLFHTDAVQAVGRVRVDVEEAHCDLLSLSAHKLNGPKGVGALYVRRGTPMEPYLTGGGQERNRRSGTLNAPAIAGLGKACEVKRREGEREAARVLALRRRLEEGVRERVEKVRLNGHPELRTPGTSNLSFLGAEGETLLINLDLAGFAVSTGAACSSGSTEPSHVLIAMNLPKDALRGSIRFSLGYGNTEEEVGSLLEVLPPIVERVRAMAPREGDRGPLERVPL